MSSELKLDDRRQRAEHRAVYEIRDTNLCETCPEASRRIRFTNDDRREYLAGIAGLPV